VRRAASQSESARAGRRVTPLRRSLTFAMGDGFFNEAITAVTTGAILAAWALYLDAGPFLVGLVAAFPLLAQLLQIPGAQFVECWGRRRLAIWGFFVRAQAYFPLVFLPFIPVSVESKRGVLIAVSLVSAIAGVIGNTAWNAWMGDVLPRRIRGRYFGSRYAVAIIGSGAATFLGALALDAGASNLAIPLSLIALFICVSGCVSAYCLSRQHGSDERRNTPPFSWHQALTAWRDPVARRFLKFQVFFNLATGVSGSFMGLHMAMNLGLSFKTIALQGALAAVIRTVFSPFWGRMVDRFGARPVLVTACGGIAIIPLVQLSATPEAPWPIWLDAVLSGIFWGAHANAIFSLPLRVAPQEHRTSYLALFTAVAGLANGLSATVSGAIADELPQRFLVFNHVAFNIQVLLGAGFLLRLASIFVAMSVVDPRSKGTRALLLRIQEAAVYRVGQFTGPVARLMGR
jgi:MFS family permease